MPLSTLQQIKDRLQDDNLCITGDGSVRDQFGSFAWCLAAKNSDTPLCKTSGQVDGHHHHRRALRAEATHLLASMSLVTEIEPFLTQSSITVPVYTDYKGLVNRLTTKYINKPSSTVLDDHVDIIYQIRSLAKSSHINFRFIYTRAIKNEEAGTGSDPEKLVQLMHIDSYEYYTRTTRLLPQYFSDYFPAVGISLVGNGRPIVSDICMALQNMERRELRQDYF